MKLDIIIDNFSIFVQNNPTKKVSTVTPPPYPSHFCFCMFYMTLALTRKICEILSKKLQKLALFKY